MTKTKTYAAAAAAAFALLWLMRRASPEKRIATSEGAGNEAERQRLAGVRGWFALQAQQEDEITKAAAVKAGRILEVSKVVQ